MAQSQVCGQAGLGHGGADAKAIYLMAHGVFVAIPVADHHRQTSGHGFNGHNAKGFLNVVRQRTKHIGTSPCRFAVFGFAAIERDHPHAGASQLGCIGIRFSDEFVGVPAAFNQHQLLARGLCGRFNRLVH